VLSVKPVIAIYCFRCDVVYVVLRDSEINELMLVNRRRVALNVRAAKWPNAELRIYKRVARHAGSRRGTAST